jgi:hypothetical protein
VIRVIDLAIVSVLAAAWLGGAALLPHALEPGRSEASGVRLNLLVDVGDGRSTNDWFTAAPEAGISSSAVLRVEARKHGVQLISRPLPVFPSECYVLELRIDVARGNAMALVQDEHMEKTLLSVALSDPDPPNTRVVFSSQAFRRLTLALSGEADTVFSLASAEIRRLRQTAPCA